MWNLLHHLFPNVNGGKPEQPLICVDIITVYPKKYAHGFVVLCFVVAMQSFIMNSHEVFIHIHQGCFAGTGAIVRLPQCQWSKPDGYGKISQCITTTKHSKAKTVCIFLGICCTYTFSKLIPPLLLAGDEKRSKVDEYHPSHFDNSNVYFVQIVKLNYSALKIWDN